MFYVGIHFCRKLNSFQRGQKRVHVTEAFRVFPCHVSIRMLPTTYM